MDKLSDDLLIEAYITAVELKLDADFIDQFKFELKRRGLEDHLID